MAAGFGKRLQPLTLETPKPLIKVNGIRMIDSVISALHENDIYEIYIVVGYKKEQFQTLEVEYPGVKLIENPYFDTCNNISSLYVAREHIKNAIILDADQIVVDNTALDVEFEKSGYNAIRVTAPTSEWVMQVANGRVIECSPTGGNSGWQLFSVSRWNESDGEKLRVLLEQEFESGNRDVYWDDVPMTLHLDEFDLGIKEMNRGAVIEIDNLDELKEIDSSYRDEGEK